MTRLPADIDAALYLERNKKLVFIKVGELHYTPYSPYSICCPIHQSVVYTASLSVTKYYLSISHQVLSLHQSPSTVSLSVTKFCLSHKILSLYQSQNTVSLSVTKYCLFISHKILSLFSHKILSLYQAPSTVSLSVAKYCPSISHTLCKTTVSLSVTYSVIDGLSFPVPPCRVPSSGSGTSCNTTT